jgi:hypothetical protein
MSHSQHVRAVTRILALEIPLRLSESEHDERDRDDREQHGDVRVEPQSETDEDQRIRGVEQVANDGGRARVDYRMSALVLYAHRSGGEGIG